MTGSFSIKKSVEWKERQTKQQLDGKGETGDKYEDDEDEDEDGTLETLPYMHRISAVITPRHLYPDLFSMPSTK
jgi:hypothetical protein